MTYLADWALWYVEAGWPVLPLHSWVGRCSCGHDDCASPAKHPRTPHGLKEASTEVAVVTGWWDRWPEANIGLRTGVVFDVLDIDGEAGFGAVDQMERDHGEESSGPTSLTGGGGAHRLFQPTGVGNRAGLLEHVDWRGRNGYIVAPPSLHASGGRYEWHQDWPADAEIQPVQGWLKDLLFPPEPVRSQERPQATRDTAAYARRAFDAELGELARAQVGSRNESLNGCAFSLYQLAYGGELVEGEVTEALRRVALGIGLGEREIEATLGSARSAGQAQPRSAPRLAVIGNTAAKPKPTAEPLPMKADDEELTGWESVDVAAVIDGGCATDPPTLYARSDGICLLYPSRLHAFNGEPESGKSWVAQYACTQVIASAPAWYIDFEDSSESVIGRLLTLGATPAQVVERFNYRAPDRPLSLEAAALLAQEVAALPPALVIIDGVTEAMSIMGLDPLDNADTAKFFRLLPRPLARRGAAVVLVDHVVKDREGRGRWAIGAQHKMAAITGASYTIEMVKPFGRNVAGFARLLITKDRPGYIRQHASGGTVAELHMDSRDTSIIAGLRAPHGGDAPLRPTGIMQRLSEALEHGPALTKNALRARVRGRNEYIDLGLQLLEAEGFIAVAQQGQARYYSSTKEFRESEEDDEMF